MVILDEKRRKRGASRGDQALAASFGLLAGIRTLALEASSRVSGGEHYRDA